MPNILVINAGSSSIKYQLIDPSRDARIASGLIERIGEASGRVVHRSGAETIERELPILDHTAGFAEVIRAFQAAGLPIHDQGIVAVGHRVVQGGSEFVRPTLIDGEVAERILDLAELAPLHNPGHHQAIVAALETFPGVPHIAVFDTAFHQTMPPKAYTYAIDPVVSERYGVRRYGFHGISHEVVSRRSAAFLGRPMGELKQIVLHLGNGASACAVEGGLSVATSMGLTPLEGLVMGTRSGDIDPGALLHLLRAGFDADGLDRLLNKESGLLGMAGSNDMRDVRAAAAAGDAAARLALDVYVHRLVGYIGSYIAILGGVDALVFTAGVGENADHVRGPVIRRLKALGFELDESANLVRSKEPRDISTPESKVRVLVIPTNEELAMAEETLEVIGAEF